MAKYFLWRAPKWVFTTLAVLSAVTSMAGSVQEGNAKSDALKAGAFEQILKARETAKIEEQKREAFRKQAADKGRQISARARSIRSKQRASIAASGRVAGVGSAQASIDETNQLEAKDNLALAYSVNNFDASSNNNAENALIAGSRNAKSLAGRSQSALIGGYVNAAGTALSTGSSIYGSYQ